MSSKDTPPTTTSPPAQIVPVDLATKASNPAVAQIRIPTVSTNIKPALLGTARPGPGPSIRPLTSGGSSGPRPGASITMIQPGQKLVVPATVGQIITGATAAVVRPSAPPPVSTPPSVRPALSTRPILAQPAPSRPGARAVATPIIRGVTPVTGHALTLRAPIQPALSGSIRLASPGSVHLIPTGGGGGPVVSTGQKGNPAITRPVSLTSPAPRPGTVLPVAGARVSVAPAMAAVSFRPSGPLVTTARPSLSPTASGAVSLVQSSVTKTIVTQNPAGVFKPITTQVSVTGAPVALKPSPVSGALPVRVPGGQRTVTVVSQVSQPLAVSLTQAPTHIQVPMVPAAVGPPKTRLAVPAGNMKLVSGVSLAPVQISGQPGPVPGARTIQLPNSVSKPGGGGAGVPVARVTPQQHTGNVSTGYVTFVPANARETGNSQASPVNLTVSRAVVAPAMAIPNFSQTTLMYDAGRAAESGQSSVTITTLPAPGDNSSTHPSSGATLTGPATITPARITPIMPGPPPALSDADKTVPGSPRPSILRKRPDSEAAVVTPVKGAILASPSSPPRPESSASSTITATSCGLSGDETHAPQPPPSIEPIGKSPRKKPRKQQMPPRESNTNVSPEWATVKRELGVRDRLEWNTRPEADWEGKVRNWQTDNMVSAGGEDMVQDQADDEEELSSEEERDKQTGSTIRGKPQVSLLNSYRHTWKSRHNHFLRYSDVKSKDERRPTVNELANQKLVLQKINGWKIYHLSAGMEEVVDMENDLSDRLEDFAQRLEDSASKDVEKELSKVQELIKANIQRSKVIQDQVSEAKDNCQTIFEHKPKIQDIILKYQSKRDRTVKGRRDT